MGKLRQFQGAPMHINYKSTRTYLNYIFTEVQMNKNLDFNDLLPWSDKIPEGRKKDQAQ